MARPIKDGVDYFPLDVNTDRKFKLLEARFGVIGFGIVVKIFQLIYAEHGYYCEWDEDTAVITAAENSSGSCQITPKDVQTIVDEALRRDIFDSGMFEKFNILTSKGIQRRYIEMTKRRERVDMIADYLLIDIPKNRVNVYINAVNVNRNPENDNNNSQSKVKESKGNESKAVVDAAAVPQSLIDSYQNNISRNFITPKELDNLEFWCGKVDTDVIEWAIGEAVGNGKRTWKYIEAILNNHYNAGRTTLDAVKTASRSFKNGADKQASVFNDGADYDEIEKIIREKM